METPADSSWHPRLGAERRPGDPRSAGTRGTGARSVGARSAAGNSRATVLGSLTIPGRPEQVSLARAFVARTLSTNQTGADADAATLLTSEIVTNAIQHTKSGIDGGRVTIVVIAVSRGVLVEIIDDGSAGTPVVKGDLYAAEGHGLFLVQHLAAQWGYLRDAAGTTVWFHLPAAYEPQQATGQPGPAADVPAQPDTFVPGTEPYRARPTHLWAAAAPPLPRPPDRPYPTRFSASWPVTLGWLFFRIRASAPRLASGVLFAAPSGSF
jgi:anti-sigma regulatory factor (Ser/Thr protein kinase)